MKTRARALNFLLRRIAFSGALLLSIGLLSTPAIAAAPEFRISAKPIRDEVQAVVSAQLAALRSGKFEEAYAFASRGIRARFDLRLFTAMMKLGYAPLLRPLDPDIGIVRDRGGVEAQVTVAFLDERKRNLVYRYWLVREAEGWRVNGVTVEQRAERGDV